MADQVRAKTSFTAVMGTAMAAGLVGLFVWGGLRMGDPVCTQNAVLNEGIQPEQLKPGKYLGAGELPNGRSCTLIVQ